MPSKPVIAAPCGKEKPAVRTPAAGPLHQSGSLALVTAIEKRDTAAMKPGLY
jgi:hypothetical protein